MGHIYSKTYSKGATLSQGKGNVVVVDDDISMREMLRDFLEAQGYDVKEYASAQLACENIGKNQLVFNDGRSEDVVVTDLRMPDMDGIELIQNLKRMRPHLPVLLITAHGSIQSAIEATRKGAYAYIVKPFKLNSFEIDLERAISHGRLVTENNFLRQEVKKNENPMGIIGKSSAMKGVFELIQRVSNATANILITGESGTGKELVAKSIHRNGPRSDKPFVAINCTAIPDTLLESELFGHLKGSFTGAISDKKGLFEEANNGTLFLDEIGDLNLGLQAKILRVLQEKEIKPIGSTKSKKVDVRIIAATHRDLKEAAKSGEFREDLYYRLSVIPVHLPTLRQRKEDVPLLANHFLMKYSALNNSRAKSFTPAAMERLINAKWEGNVRELENLVERTVVLCDKESIDVQDFILSDEATGVDSVFRDALIDWPTLEELERRYIKAVLEKVGGRKERAAKLLGINRRTLYRKEREFVSDHLQ